MARKKEMVQSEGEVWFPEPSVTDDSWSGRDEPIFQWLHRSTICRAQAARQFLNFNLSQLPEAWRNRLYHDLKHRWQSAFFELIVARTLQVLGAELRVEEPTATGRRPDFQAIFPSGTVIVEATSPLIDCEIDKHSTNSAPLLQIVEDLAPQGATIMVKMLPTIGPADSKRTFKHIVSELLKVPAPQGDEIRNLRTDTDQGPIELTLLARQEGWPVIGGGPGIAYFSDRLIRIHRAIRKKRQQVRGVLYPVLLAIDGNWRCEIKDVDQVLFGSTVQYSHGAVEFMADGEFAKSQSQSPTYTAVLFYSEISFSCRAEPVLYQHPKRVGSLPAAFDAVRQRLLIGTQIVEQPVHEHQLLTALQPVNLEETG
jgi:hypothetical protein